jgi:hypothetical protein
VLVQVTVPATTGVRAVLGDWLCRDLVPLWLYGAGLETDAARCRALPPITAQLLERPVLLRPLVTVMSHVRTRSNSRWMEAIPLREKFCYGVQVCRDVLGEEVLDTALVARSCFPSSRLGAWSYAVVMESVCAAELRLEEPELRSLRRRTQERSEGLVHQMVAAAPSAPAERG